MAKTVEIEIEGKPVQGVVVNVKESVERWTSIQLEDGTKIRLRPVVTETARIDQFDKDGQPVYVLKSATIMTVDAPPNPLRGAVGPGKIQYGDTMIGISCVSQRTDVGWYAPATVLSPTYSQLGHAEPDPVPVSEIPVEWINPASVRHTEIWSRPEPDSGTVRLLSSGTVRSLDSGVEDKFRRLVREWKSRDCASSLVMDHICLPAYQKIIGMGEAVVPLLLEQLRDEGDNPDHWFWALHFITEEDPVPAEDRGDMVRMAAAWLEWGRRDDLAR